MSFERAPGREESRRTLKLAMRNGVFMSSTLPTRFASGADGG
jgi:hypothetical protein